MSKKILAIVGVLGLLVVDAAAAYTVGANSGREEVRNTRLEFLSTRSTAQTAGADTAQTGAQATGQGNPRGQQAQTGQQGQFAQGVRGGVNGTVKSVKGNTLEVTAQNGNVVTVSIDAQTQIQKTTTGALADIAVGTRITVLSDQTGANVTARVIQLTGN
ncbi:MAG: hypothetical protein HY327_07215 [Chloroflexi bacterium]|nr:hypothetical protein [Chloroflexota bacterium]